jgi:DNA-binding LytR/AlgR family response regulator
MTRAQHLAIEKNYLVNLNIQSNEVVKDFQFLTELISEMTKNSNAIQLIKPSNQHYAKIISLLAQRPEGLKIDINKTEMAELVFVKDHGIIILPIHKLTDLNTTTDRRMEPNTNRHESRNSMVTSWTTQKIVTHSKNGHEIHNPSNIQYIQAWEKYAHICTKDGQKHVVYKGLKELENELVDSRLVRCHKSFMVNLDQIIQISKSNQLTLISGKIIPVARRKKIDVLQYLNLKK